MEGGDVDARYPSPRRPSFGLGSVVKVLQSVHPCILPRRMEPDGTGTDVLGKPKLRKISVRKEIQEWTKDEQNDTREREPVTPAGRVFSQPSFDCYILVIFRLRTRLNVEAIITGLQSTLIKHKRFSSVMRRNKDGSLFWVPTQVNISDHVVVPSIDNETPDFVENYAAKLASAPRMDPSRPLWEIHLLDVESGEAAASAVMRVHHSLGDGVSLMSLFLSCTRKSGDPDSLPTIPRPLRAPRNPFSIGALWGILLMLWYTLVDVLYFVGTLLWIKDSDTPVKGFQGMESSPKQIVHETLSLQDIKFVKNAIKGTVNDVLLGISSAGILTYLERKYEEEGKGEVVKEGNQRKANHGDRSGKGKLPSKLRIRSTVLVNTRPSPGIHELAEMMESGKEARWGNNLGYVILSLPMLKHENPLDYVHEASVIFGRKKLSMEAPLTYASGTLVLKLLGDKAGARLTHNMVANTTFSFSNMMGPVEEIEFFGHPIIDILPTVTGHPHALTMHFQSYLDKLTLVMSASTAVIGDPKQLCLDCVNAFHSMKQAADAASKTT